MGTTVNVDHVGFAIRNVTKPGPSVACAAALVGYAMDTSKPSIEERALPNSGSLQHRRHRLAAHLQR